MSDQIMNNYGLNEMMHADLMALSARFTALQEEIKSSVHQLEDVWKGSAADGHLEWQMHFDKLSQEVQAAAHQAFNTVNEHIGPGGTMQNFDQMAASRFTV